MKYTSDISAHHSRSAGEVVAADLRAVDAVEHPAGALEARRAAARVGVGPVLLATAPA